MKIEIYSFLFVGEFPSVGESELHGLSENADQNQFCIYSEENRNVVLAD